VARPAVRERRPSTSAPISDLQGPVGPGFSRPKHKRTFTGFGAGEIKSVEGMFIPSSLSNSTSSHVPHSHIIRKPHHPPKPRVEYNLTSDYHHSIDPRTSTSSMEEIRRSGIPK